MSDVAAPRRAGPSASAAKRRPWPRALAAACLAWMATTGVARPARADGPTDAQAVALPSTASSTGDPASSGPEAAAQEGLRYDLDKMVELRQQRGWTIDRFEIEAMLADALLSVCRVRAVDRRATVVTYDADITALGGPAAARWRAGQRDLDALGPTIALERARALLLAAMARVDADCPFHVAPSARFRGRQRDSEGVTLNLEGGGLASVGVRGGRIRVGGGGAGRVSASFGLGPSWNLRVGPELGGAALVDDQLRTDDVTVDFLMALPVALRRTLGTYIVDIEAAPVLVGIPWQQADQRWGGRVAMLVGVSALRLRQVLPWTGLVVMGEAIAPRGGEAWMWSVRAGVRVGFAWSRQD